MSNPIQGLLNVIINEQLPKVNSEIQEAIKNNHLDPWGQVAHGTANLGSVNLGVCNAEARANYHVKNMTGLSSLNIDQLEIKSVQQGANSSEYLGTVHMSALLRGNLTGHLGGRVEASCGFMHPSVAIGGLANVNGLTADATGSFTASMDGNKVCLNSITLSAVSINYANVHVETDGLGIFNEFTAKLIDMITELFKGQISGAISSAITPIISKELESVLPQCQNL